MSTRIRLQRQGRKKRAFYNIVVADSRSKRDGAYIQKLGTYNPIPFKEEININTDLSLKWLQTGAEPTNTVRSILSKKGVLLKKHLLEGVKKGAFTIEKAKEKYDEWIKNKNNNL